MTRTRASIATVSAVALLMLSGCANTAESSAGGEGAEDEHNRVDVMFAQMMIPHHDDAISMAGYLDDVPGLDPRVDELAATIIQSQEAENREMNAWLTEMGYSGVARSTTGVNADALAGSSTAEIEDAFLTEMIAHHEHGVDMARGAVNRGESPVITALAEEMAEEQTREIELMRDLLSEG